MAWSADRLAKEAVSWKDEVGDWLLEHQSGLFSFASGDAGTAAPFESRESGEEEDEEAESDAFSPLNESGDDSPLVGAEVTKKAVKKGEEADSGSLRQSKRPANVDPDEQELEQQPSRKKSKKSHTDDYYQADYRDDDFSNAPSSPDDPSLNGETLMEGSPGALAARVLKTTNPSTNKNKNDKKPNQSASSYNGSKPLPTTATASTNQGDKTFGNNIGPASVPATSSTHKKNKKPQKAATSTSKTAVKDAKLKWNYEKRYVLELLFTRSITTKNRERVFNHLYQAEVRQLGLGVFTYSKMSQQNGEKKRQDRPPSKDWQKIAADMTNNTNVTVRATISVKVNAAALALSIKLDG